MTRLMINPIGSDFCTMIWITTLIWRGQEWKAENKTYTLIGFIDKENLI